MHLALLVSEIVDRIFGMAIQMPSERKESYDGNLRKPKQQALNLALTCKHFLPFAFSHGWRAVSTLVSLLQTLPQDIWTDTVKHVPKGWNPNLWQVRKVNIPRFSVLSTI
jgi:hypothetical protein